MGGYGFKKVENHCFSVMPEPHLDLRATNTAGGKICVFLQSKNAQKSLFTDAENVNPCQ